MTDLARPLAGLPIPVHGTLGISIVEAADRELIARLPASAQLRDESGAVVPGSLSVLADVCCGAVVATGLPPDRAAITAQLRVEFVQAIPRNVRWLEGRARLDSVDDQGGLARAELVGDRDELLAVASLRSISSVGRRIAPTTDGLSADDALRPPDGPIEAFLGKLTSSSGDGRAEWTLSPTRCLTNRFNAVHGGIVAMLSHLVATQAQRSALVPGEQLVPLDLALNYYRGVPVGAGAATAAAEVTHHGRRFLVADGRVVRADGRVAVRFSVGAQIRPG